MTTPKQELREKIEKTFVMSCSNHEYQNDGKEWCELHTPTLTEEIQTLITQTVNEVLGRIEAESVQEFPMSSGENIAFVPLSAIQAIRKEWGK